MKIPDIPDEKNDINDVALYRKKKKRVRIIRNAVILVILCVGAFLVWQYREVIFEPLRGIASKINNTTTQDVGFPIDLPASSDYRFLPMSDSFALTTDTYLYTYSTGGGQYFALQHGYVNPMAVSNSKRLLIYDKGGHDFALYNKTSEIFKQRIENEVIVSAFISDSEHVAVVTSGGRFSNIVHVYDGNGKWLYTHKFIDDNVMQAAFSADKAYLYLSRIKSDNGDIVTEITKYRLNDESEEAWTYKISDSIPLELYVSGDTVKAVCDNSTVSLNAETGELKGSFKYGGELKDFDCSDSGSILAVNDYTASGSRLILLDNDCSELARADISGSINQLLYEDDRVYLLTGRSLDVYDNAFSLVGSHELDDEYSSFVKAGSSALLLGYNTIISIGI